MIVVNNEIKYHEVCIEHLNARARNRCRTVVLKNQDATYVIVLYNPPNGNPYHLAEQQTAAMLNLAETFPSANVIPACDLNMPNAEWETNKSKENYDELILG